MKAVFISSYGTAEKSLQLRECADPVPAENEVLIETEAFGINFADVMARKGLYGAAPKPPFIPGYEVCGHVVKVGTAVNEKWIGKRVAAFTRFGGYAQRCVTRAEALVEINDTMPPAHACALCTQYATAWYAVNECVKVRNGERALVYAAAGGVGTALLQLLALHQIEITAIVSSEEKKQQVLQQGAQHVIVTSNATSLPQVTNGNFDLIFNPVYGKTLKRDIKLLAPGGRLILFGASSRLNHARGFLPTLFYAFRSGRIFPVFLMMQSKTIAGINMLEIADKNPKLLTHCMNEIFKLYLDKKIHPVAHEFHVNEIQRVHTDMEKRKTTGKQVIRW